MQASLRNRPLWVSVAVFASCAVSSAALGTGGDTQHTAPASLESLAGDIATYRQHETTLSNPFFEGRAPGTKGNRLAADYIEWNYTQLGLLPAFPGDVKGSDGEVTSVARWSYRQVFNAPASKRPGDSLKLVEQSASYTTGDEVTQLAAGKDFNTIGHTGSGEVTGPLVFGGYSISSDDKNYDSYPPNTDLAGKVVMILRFEPMDKAGHSLWALKDEPQKWSFAAGVDPKMGEAASRHAAGIILVNPPGVDDERVSKLEDMGFAGQRSQKIPVIMMSTQAADALVKAADAKHRSLMDLRRIADKDGGFTELPGATVTLKTKVEKVALLTDNVGAILPGKGKLADQFIVIGSHYDHVGYGYFGSLDGAAGRGNIHPGADDNASGTSGNLLLAKKLAKAYSELPADADVRSVLFLAFSAEESGLVGSAWYVKHPIVPLSAHSLMLNMDMIGRLRQGRLEVGGVATAEGLKDWTKGYWNNSGLNIKTSNIGASNSDHYSFYQKKIPDLFFFTGLHKEYHTPRDTINLINFDGAAEVVDLVYRVALDAAERPEGFAFADGTDEPKDEEADAKGDPKPSVKAERTAKADSTDKSADPHAAAKEGAGPLSGVKVRFGIMPDYTNTKSGVMIQDLSADKGLAAEKAGLKGGDLMTKWDGTDLEGVENWMEVMGKYKPGDTVVITYVRDGKEQTTKAVLTSTKSQNN